MSSTVAFVGLGAMGFGMASSLVRAGFQVRGYDISQDSMQRLTSLGGLASTSPRNAAQDAALLIVMVTNSDQAEEVLYGSNGAVPVLPHGAAVIICSTVAPAYVRDLDRRLSAGKILLVDAPVSGGVVKAANGTLTIMAAGSSEAIKKSKPVLSAMSEKLYIIEGGAGAGSSIKMVNQLLAGVHIAAAAEAMALGARAGINTRLLYDIISNAAGSSWMFVNRVPHMLDNDYTPLSALNIFVKDLGIVVAEGKEHIFPLPLASAAHQQFLLGSSAGFGRQDDAAVVKVWEKAAGICVSSKKEADFGVDLVPGTKPGKIAFLGLGAMGFGMATWLHVKGYSVCGFDVFQPVMNKFSKVGGDTSESAAGAAKDAELLIVMVANEKQVENVLFGDGEAVSALSPGSTVIVCSTVSPEYARMLEIRLQDRGVLLVDAPVSGGVVKAANGSLTIMASGSEDGLKNAGPILSALSSKLYIIKGGVGAGSTVKMVNQLLIGIHLAAAAEAVAFGARVGLNTQVLYDIISNAAGSSWVFIDRVPQMITSDYTPYAKLDNLLTDMDMILKEAKKMPISLPLGSASQQLLLAASAAGWGQEDYGAIVKVFQKLTGVNVVSSEPKIAKQESNCRLPIVDKATLFGRLPPEWSEDPTDITAGAVGKTKVLVVLDDDPTGTQTVHDVTVLTEWSIKSLKEEFERHPPCFFILTNSRALDSDKAIALTKEICKNVTAAAAAAGNVEYTIVLRGDSTLRGHFPEEADAVAEVLGESDAWIICPFFWQGGRYTVDDIHYVADGEKLLPAAQTEFARDSAFGYKSSNLRQWVEEKTKGRVSSSDVASVSIETIRKGGPSAVCDKLCSLQKNTLCVVNAVSERDMSVFAAGMAKAEAKGKRFLCRTAAGFVSARIGIKPKDPISPSQLEAEKQSSWLNGGLIVVGSYVPKTTAQVDELLRQCGNYLEHITVSVTAVALSSEEIREAEIVHVSRVANHFLAAGHDTLIMTSRDLVKGTTRSESLEIGMKISSALVEIVKRIRTRPRYIIGKGGITSSDLATKAMGATRANVAGQAISGVPFWKLGPGSRHPGIPYIVFPGNVGGPEALAEVVRRWSRPTRKSTREILEDAETGGYGVGAFNVYNLEGAMAVIAAAEEEKSPAILQIHPAAYHYGGSALVASCVAAARAATVPVSVHLDHGNEEAEVIDALELGFHSVMVDGSNLPFEENLAFTKRVADVARSKNLTVEAELGRLSGTEDGLTVEEYEAKYTDVEQAKEFLEQTGVDALAVCIGNVHGKYPSSGPRLKMELLKELRALAKKYGVFLVLHGASGLPVDMVKACIDNGVRKLNVNTELRAAYMKTLEAPGKDILGVMERAQNAMQEVAAEKMRMFGSSGKA